MKNLWIVPLFAALFALIFLTSCGTNAEKNTQTQETATQGATAANPEPTAGMNKAEGNESAENEAAEKAGKQGAAAGISPQATVINNLTDAFKGETTASAKYAAYAKKAQEEGFPQIAMLFKAASTSENIHANNHKAVMEDMGAAIPAIKPEFTVKTTKENLQDAITGESYEITTMYPEFLANAKTLGNQLAQISLNYAYKTEQKHKVLYDKALAALESNQVKALSMQYYVCPTCGNTYDVTPPKRCGISMTNSEKFILISKV
jgi:rubrerythrin